MIDPRYLAIEVATTTPDVRTGQLLEVCALVLDGKLETIGTWSETVRPSSWDDLTTSPYLAHHYASGLVVSKEGALRTSGESTFYGAAEGYLIKVARCFPDQRPIWIGSVYAWDFVSFYLRGLARFFSEPRVCPDYSPDGSRAAIRAKKIVGSVRHAAASAVQQPSEGRV